MLAPVARAQGGASGSGHATDMPADAVARAKQHFQRGRELYQAGAYREAIAELEAAHKLDPTAKDLVYNLAVVNEKLGQIDAAIQYLHAYLAMELDSSERARAEAAVKRLEGSKKEVLPVVAPVPSNGTTPSPVPPPPEAPSSDARYGRIDAATITGASVAVAGLAVGTIFGIKALHDRPSGLVSGENGNTPQTIESDQTHAHTEAIVADVGFGVGVAALAITAYLYFGRTKAAPPPSPETSVTVVPVVSGGGGAVFVVGGTF